MPKLRFPEFRDAGPWELRLLSEVLLEHRLKSTDKEEVFSVSVHKGLINQKEHLCRSFSAASTDNYNRVLPGDHRLHKKDQPGELPI